MPIFDVHPEHAAMAPRWRRCRDVAGGSDAVKAATTTYLPRPPGMDTWDGSYAAYVARALFYNAMQRTVDGLAGSILQKAPTITAPPRLAPWLADVTMADQSLELVAGRIVREVLTVGRVALLVDWPVAGSGEARPYMACYEAEDLISWRSESRGGDQTLTRAVFRETCWEADEADPSKITASARYRELVLTPGGEATVRLHARLPQSHVRGGREIWIATEPEVLTRRGEPLTFLPVVIFGAAGLGPRVARPPLEDLAHVNLSHYRSSADREQALFYVSQPTPWVSGMKGEGPLKIGSAVAWNLDQGGQAGMLEITGAGIGSIKEAMEEKARMMATLGARLLEEQPRGSETATAVGMRHAGEHATLRAIAQVAEQGLTIALQMLTWWAGLEAKPEDTAARVELSKDFWTNRATPDEIRTLILAWQADGISRETLHYNLVRGEVMRPGTTAEEEERAIRNSGGPPARDEDDVDDAA